MRLALSILLLVCNSAYSNNQIARKGLAGSTLVLTDSGSHIKISHLGFEHVKTCDAAGNLADNRILNSGRGRALQTYVIKVLDVEIEAGPEQLFYDPRAQKWISAEKLTTDNFLIDIDKVAHPILSIQPIHRDYSGIMLYDLQMGTAQKNRLGFYMDLGKWENEVHKDFGENDNFYVSKRNILTHNFFHLITAVIVEQFTSSAIVATLAAYGASILGNYANNRNFDISFSLPIDGFRWDYNPVDILKNRAPPKFHLPWENTAGTRDFYGRPEWKHIIENRQKDQASERTKNNDPDLGGSQANELAKQLGYPTRIPPPKLPFDSKGKPGYTDGRRIISVDRDRHKGATWKVHNMQGDRQGSFNRDLTQKLGD